MRDMQLKYYLDEKGLGAFEEQLKSLLKGKPELKRRKSFRFAAWNDVASSILFTIYNIDGEELDVHASMIKLHSANPLSAAL